MKNKWVLLLTVCIILSMGTSTFALESSEEVVTKEISFIELVDEILTNNMELEILDDKIKLAERRLRSAERKSEDVDSLSSITSDSTRIEQAKVRDLYPVQREKIINDYTLDKADKIESLQVEAAILYKTVLNLEEQIGNAKEFLETARQEYNTKKSEYDLGQITLNELKNHETSVEESKLTINTLERQKTTSIMSLNKLAGFELSTNLVLDDNLTFSTAIPDYDIDAIVDDMRESSREVMDVETKIEHTILERDVVRRNSGYEKPDNYETLEDNIIDYKKELTDTKNSIEVSIRSDYNSLLNLKDDLTIATLKYENAKSDYTVNQAKYDYGMITWVQLQKSKDALTVADQNIKNAEKSLYKAKVNFANTID